MHLFVVQKTSSFQKLDQCSDLLYEATGARGGRCIGTIGMVYAGTLFHRRQRGIPMHSYEDRSEIRELTAGREMERHR